MRFTFERFKASGMSSPIYASIQQIDAIEAVDELTVRFRFTSPAANFWSAIAMPYAGIISPLPPASSTMPARANRNRRIHLDDWQAGQSITLRRNPDYNWGPPTVDNRSAYLGVSLQDHPRHFTARRPERGEVDDLQQAVAPAEARRRPAGRYSQAVLSGLVHLGFNVRRSRSTRPSYAARLTPWTSSRF